jgi:hypothetical protein
MFIKLDKQTATRCRSWSRYFTLPSGGSNDIQQRHLLEKKPYYSKEISCDMFFDEDFAARILNSNTIPYGPMIFNLPEGNHENSEL